MLWGQKSVLIVSKDQRAEEFIKGAMPQSEFYPVHTVGNAAEARRTLRKTPINIIVINIPLADEFGAKLAQDCSKSCGVMVLVKPDMYEKAVYKLEPFGVLTLSKAVTKAMLYQSLKVIAASDEKIRQLEQNAKRLEQKLLELKLVNEAKSVLIERDGMSEEQSHRYIEKLAMDNGLKKADAARRVLDGDVCSC